MTPLEYLSSPRAVEDVRFLIEALAKKDYPYAELSAVSQADFYWLARPEEVWTEIEIRQIRGVIDSLSCYYRSEGSGFVVSDCGEMVSEVMRRTGLREHEAQLKLKSAVFGSHHKNFERIGEIVLYAPNWSIHTDVESATDLPAAIVAVLSAIAKVREAMP